MEAHDDTNTRLGLAARLGNILLLKELLHQGYPTNGHNNRGWRPLHEAAAGGHVECVRLLLGADDAEVDALTHKNLTALYLACEPGECHMEVVKLLLSAGADPNMKCCPLSKAVLGHLYNIVKLLLDAGGDPNMMDFNAETPLMAAAMERHLEIARLLMERGAKADAYDKEGPSAIHLLLLSQLHLIDDSTLIPFIDLLLNGGLDVNTLQKGGATALIVAVRDFQGNKARAATHLLDLGADPNIQDALGLVALHHAIECFPDFSTERHYGHVLKRLLDLTSRELVIPAKLRMMYYTIFHSVIQWDKLNTLKLMVNVGLPPDAFLKNSSFASLAEAEGVQYISDEPWLDKSNVKWPYGQVKLRNLGIEVDTPLGFLLSLPMNEKRVEMAKFMIDKGSNVNIVSPICLPPLVAAVIHQRARYNHGCPGLDILEHLLNNGVDVMHKIRCTDILPAALHISSLFNAQAFFALLVRCIPVHEIYTPWTLKSLSQLYDESENYKVNPLWPWRVISWLNIVNVLVPQLPLDTKNTFDIHRMVEDDNLSRAWDDLDAQIGSPKKLEQLCVLTVRRVVGERRGWNQLTTFLRKLTLPNLILDKLMFKQMEFSRLGKWPPLDAMAPYELAGANSFRMRL